MRTIALALGSSFVAFVLYACSDSETNKTTSAEAPSCKEIQEACHPVDPGSGEIHECHESAEGSAATEAACAARKPACLALCAGAVDAGSDVANHDAEAGPTQQSVELSFIARVGVDPFECTRTYANIGTQSSTVEPLAFAFYVHDVTVTTTEGTDTALALTQDGKWQYQNVVLLDFENNTGTCANGTVDTNALVKGTFLSSSKRVTAVKFKVGLPASLNHGDVGTQPSPLNLSSLSWDWQSGYKFMRLDFRTRTEAGVGATTLFHLGSTNCTGVNGAATCANANVPTVTLTGAFDPAANKIVFDYKALVEGINVSANLGGAPGCMSGSTDPECAPTFQKLGLDITSGNPSTTAQTVFSIQ